MEKCIEQSVIHHLNRVIGQLNKLVTVIGTTDCESVLMQLKAAEKNIKSVSIAVLKNHTAHCIKDGFKTDPEGTSESFNKLLERYL